MVGAKETEITSRALENAASIALNKELWNNEVFRNTNFMKTKTVLSLLWLYVVAVFCLYSY